MPIVFNIFTMASMSCNKYLRSVLLVLLCATLQTGCSSALTPGSVSLAKQSEKVAEEDFASGASSAFAKGDYINAYALYEKLLAQDPENQDALFYFAESLRMSGHTGRALDQYNKLLARNPNNFAAMEGRGLCFLQHGDVQRALAELNLVVEKDATRWRALNAIGVVYSISGKDDEARKYYDMALDISGGNPSILNNIALGVAFAGDATKGVELLRGAIKTLEEGNKKKTLENNLALIYGISGKMDEAEVILRKSLPEHAVYNNLGFYAKLASDKKLSWSYLSKAISSSPVFYEKAENNMKDLVAPVVASGSAYAVAEAQLLPDVQNNLPELSKSEIQALQTADEQSPKLLPIKAWRGTKKLPLPSLRPQY